MNRTYKLKHLANKGKQMKVIQTVRAYRETAALIARDQWRCFYESARPFNKQCDIKHIGTQLSERFKQTCQYENPAYTSQECSVCGYVDKNNRKSQSVFECKFCHSIMHADVNAPRNLRQRSSLSTAFPLYMSHANILRSLTKSFVDSLSDTERKYHLRHSDAVSLLSANPYFAGNLAQLKGS